ncbi:HlyD family secretion protein [Povalibacter sp.]|uniref:HlyD family secretion protein n=1 Tax=Povalibacter sp. TaxID=1962978 RepID=UPI002F3F34D7
MTSAITDKSGHRRWLWMLAAAVVLFVMFGIYLAVRPAPGQIQGMVDADTFTVATKAPARLLELRATEGQRVQKGQLLAILASPEVEARDQQANAVLLGAEALRQISRDGARAEDVRSTQAIWRSAEAAATLASQTARRAENLYKEGVISTQRRDEAVAARAATAAQAEAARQQYVKLTAGFREEDKTVADAQVEIARAGVSAAQSFKDEIRLVSPVSGEVAERFANPGELVLIGVPVFTVIDIDHAWALLSLREDQFQGIRQGAVLRGSVPALGLTRQRFRVTHISPQGDFATWRSSRQSRGYDVRSFEIKAEPEPRIDDLRPGMSVLFDWPFADESR